MNLQKSNLDLLYRRYNHPSFIGHDPVGFLHHYPDIIDREIVGLVAATLAYGRVAQIFKSVSAVLTILSPSPFHFLRQSSIKTIQSRLSGFRHRVTSAEDLVRLLCGIQAVIKTHGSIGAAFRSGYHANDDTILPALEIFVKELSSAMGGDSRHILPSPERKSACKRLNLYLRWMIRKDAIDPGGWQIPPSKLIIPLDVHMHRFALTRQLTARRQASLAAAIEITKQFACVSPEDPVKYDFTLAHMGMNPKLASANSPLAKKRSSL